MNFSPQPTKKGIATIAYDYSKKVDAKIINTGETVKMYTSEPSDSFGTISFNSKVYHASQLHFHAPAEHLIDGVRRPLEMHIVHSRPENSDLIVLGLTFIETAYDNPWLEKFIAAGLPSIAGHYSEVPAQMADYPSLNDFLRQSFPVWSYLGSLTSPPCDEVVTWLFVPEPLPASTSQLAKLAALQLKDLIPGSQGNFRAIQNNKNKQLSRTVVMKASGTGHYFDYLEAGRDWSYLGQCGSAVRQSPIDIHPSLVDRSSTVNVHTTYVASHPKRASVQFTNNGHTIDISPIFKEKILTSRRLSDSNIDSTEVTEQSESSSLPETPDIYTAIGDNTIVEKDTSSRRVRFQSTDSSSSDTSNNNAIVLGENIENPRIVHPSRRDNRGWKSSNKPGDNNDGISGSDSDDVYSAVQRFKSTRQMGALTINSKTFAPAGFHMHAPSEHLWSGVRRAIELHVVHRELVSGNELAVLAFSFVESNDNTENPFLAAILSNPFPSSAGSRILFHEMSIDLQKLLPVAAADRRAITYLGSLTTPPCSEVATWIVLEEPLKASAEQIKRVEELHNMKRSSVFNNARIQQNTKNALARGIKSAQVHVGGATFSQCKESRPITIWTDSKDEQGKPTAPTTSQQQPIITVYWKNPANLRFIPDSALPLFAVVNPNELNKRTPMLAAGNDLPSKRASNQITTGSIGQVLSDISLSSIAVSNGNAIDKNNSKNKIPLSSVPDLKNSSESETPCNDAPLGCVVLSGVSYPASSLTFRSPALHSIDGARAPLEIQVRHKPFVDHHLTSTNNVNLLNSHHHSKEVVVAIPVLPSPVASKFLATLLASEWMADTAHKDFRKVSGGVGGGGVEADTSRDVPVPPNSIQLPLDAILLAHDSTSCENLHWLTVHPSHGGVIFATPEQIEAIVERSGGATLDPAETLDLFIIPADGLTSEPSATPHQVSHTLEVV